MSSAPREDLVDRNRLWGRLNDAAAALTDPPRTPLAVVDLDAFDANADDLVRRAGSKPVRVASKSLRVPALVRRALAKVGFSGVLGYTLREALWLVDNGVTDDVVVAYPTTDRGALALLGDSPSALQAVTLMVDDAAHLDLIASVVPVAARVRICLDVDAGLSMAGAHVGPKRSSLREVEQVTALADEVLRRDQFRLVGVMTYEGQVAGVPDDVPGQRAKSLAVRRIKAASLSQLLERRAAIARALRERTELEFWNAGGSGSVEDSGADGAVTEIAAGSGLLVPGLFDHYRSFTPRPAAYFGLPVTRRPRPGVVTVHGGGLIASGPVGDDRAPIPWAPPGLELTGMEGAGEVQTPLTGHPTSLLSLGDLVWFRHAKSGELFEHVGQTHLLQGDHFVDLVDTYRGVGLWG